jgi:hypothetical protein
MDTEDSNKPNYTLFTIKHLSSMHQTDKHLYAYSHIGYKQGRHQDFQLSLT